MSKIGERQLPSYPMWIYSYDNEYFDDFANHITRYNSTYYTTKIIQSYLKKNSNKDIITKKEAAFLS